MNELAVSRAVETDIMIRQRLLDMKEAAFDLGRYLYEFRLDRMWLSLGYDTFTAYLANPDVDIPKSSAYRAIAVYAKFELELEVPRSTLELIGVSKLEKVINIVDKDNLEEMLAEATALTRNDLVKRVSENFDNSEINIDDEYAEPYWEAIADNLANDLTNVAGYLLQSVSDYSKAKKYKNKYLKSIGG